MSVSEITPISKEKQQTNKRPSEKNNQENQEVRNQETRLIRKYENRKLYDTLASKYVTLGHLFELIRSGVSIRVLDNKTGADITYLTLLNILFEAEKEILLHKQGNSLSLSQELQELEEDLTHVLFRTIRQGNGSLSSHIQALEKLSAEKIDSHSTLN